jgi:hypothetical protein
VASALVVPEPDGLQCVDPPNFILVENEAEARDVLAEINRRGPPITPLGQ